MKPVFVKPDLNKELRVKVDMLDYMTRGVLLMKCENKKWRPLVFISKLLNEAERNYKIHNKKASSH